MRIYVGVTDHQLRMNVPPHAVTLIRTWKEFIQHIDLLKNIAIHRGY